MKKIIVIGNGESRSQLKLDELGNSPIIGCNALVREIAVEHLICVDRRMVKEALQSINCPKNIYTREDWIKGFTNPIVKTVPKLVKVGSNRWNDPFHWGSGPYALLLACSLGYTNLDIYGFDLYSTTSTVNNVYKGTENYVKADYRPVDPSYWIKQISDTINWFPNVTFNFFNTENWIMPLDWCKINTNKNILTVDNNSK